MARSVPALAAGLAPVVERRAALGCASSVGSAASPAPPAAPAVASIANAAPMAALSLEENIRIIMEQQVARLGAALEARVDLRAAEVSRRVAEAEHGWRAERKERERAMMALQRDILTLTESAVKERDIMEKIFEDLETVRNEHSELLTKAQLPASRAPGKHPPAGTAELEARFGELCRRTDEALSGIAAQRMDLAGMIEKSVAELCAALALQQQEEMLRLKQEMRAEHRDCLDSLPTEDRVNEIMGRTATELDAMRAEVRGLRHAEGNMVGQLCSNALAGWEEGHTETIIVIEQRVERLREALDNHINEVQRLSSETTVELQAERDDRRQNLAELRTSLNTTISDSVHRIELLESDLIDMTRTLKRLDVKVKDVARASNFKHPQGLSAAASPQAATPPVASTHPAAMPLAKLHSLSFPSSMRLPKEGDCVVVSGLEDIESTGSDRPLLSERSLLSDRPLLSARSGLSGPGHLGSLLEAVEPQAATPQDAEASAAGAPDTPMDSTQQLRVDLIRRAAGCNAGQNSIFRRARELGEV